MEARLLASSLRRFGWLLVLLTVLGGVLGLAVGVTSARRYQATASVSVAQPNLSAVTGSQAQLDPATYVATQVGVISSNQIAAQVAQKVGLTVDQVARQVAVAQRQSSDIIDITATSGSGAMSARLANLVATTYIAQVTAQTNAAISTTIAKVQANLIALQHQLAGASGATAAGIETQIGPTAQNLAQLESTSAVALLNTQIVDNALVPASPLPRHTSAKLLIGLGAGLALGVLLAVILSVLRPRLLRASDVEDALGMSAAARLPYVATWSGTRDPAARNYRDAPEFAGEMAKVAVFVEAARAARNCKTVLVASLEGRAGVSTVARALASELRHGRRVVQLVDLAAASMQSQVQRDRASVMGASAMGAGRAVAVGDAQAERQFAEREFAERQFAERQVAGGTVGRPGGPRPMTDAPRGPGAALGGGPAGGRQGGRGRPGGIGGLSDEDFDADVLVMDGGSLTETASVVSLARSCDVTVLVVPLPYSDERYLHAVTRATFADARGQLLIVTNDVADHRSTLPPYRG